VLIQKAGKVSVHSFVTRDEFVREGKTGHKSTLLDPEDGTERAGEEDTFDGSEGNKTLGKRIIRLDPLESPVSLLSDGGDIFYSFEEEFLFCLFFNISVDENRVGLRVNIFHHHLEAVEATSLGDLDFSHEPLSQVLEDDTI